MALGLSTWRHGALRHGVTTTMLLACWLAKLTWLTWMTWLTRMTCLTRLTD
jgi:hypothetical protein